MSSLRNCDSLVATGDNAADNTADDALPDMISVAIFAKPLYSIDNKTKCNCLVARSIGLSGASQSSWAITAYSGMSSGRRT